jgi:hypothetical protein
MYLGAIVLSLQVLRPEISPECREMAVRIAVTEVAFARPRLEWSVAPGVEHYRVEIEGRIPEGRVLMSLDTRVSGTTFQTPQSLTDFKVSLKVRVTAGCPADDGSRLRERAASFYVDTSPLCPVPTRIALSGDRRSIEWSATPGALRYEVSLRREDGSEVERGPTQRPRFPVPETGETLIAVVRPYCETGFGARGVALLSTGHR